MSVNKFSNSKVYKIYSLETDKIFIGTTTRSLEQAYASHRNLRNRCPSKKILVHMDSDIMLIENFTCSSKEELKQRENYYIEKYRDIAVNK